MRYVDAGAQSQRFRHVPMGLTYANFWRLINHTYMHFSGLVRKSLLGQFFPIVHICNYIWLTIHARLGLQVMGYDSKAARLSCLFISMVQVILCYYLN